MRIFASLLTFVLLFSGASVQAVSFVELPKDHPLAKSFGQVISGGSRSRTLGNPVRNTNRDRFQFFSPTKSNGMFSDVPADHAHAEAIAYVVEQGMMNGSRSGSFHPGEEITRAEFTSIIADRIFSRQFIEDCFENISFPYPPEYALLFEDVPKEGEDAKRICAALMGGVIHGYPDRTFKKNDPINFAEASKIVARAYDVSLLPQRGSGLEWFKEYVSHLADRAGIPLSITKFDHTLTRAEAAEMLYRADAGITSKPSKTYRDLMVAIVNVVQSFVEWWLL